VVRSLSDIIAPSTMRNCTRPFAVSIVSPDSTTAPPTALRDAPAGPRTFTSPYTNTIVAAGTASARPWNEVSSAAASAVQESRKVRSSPVVII